LETPRSIEIVMPYMSGGDLLESVIPEVGMATDLVICYARQIFSALSHVHGMGFAHRYA
jgi:serine/threonine protein kinase